MKLVCSYGALVDVLVDISSVVEDAMSSEDMKNIIFRISNNKKVEVIGINQLITYRKEFPDGEYRVISEDSEFSDAGVYFMQVKSKELTQYLNTFKSVRRTKVTDVELLTVGGKVRTTVVEEDLESGQVYTSKWEFDNIPIKKNQMEQINLKMPEESIDVVETKLIMFYTANLLPIMQNGSNLYSKLVFGTDMVVAFNAAFNTLMNNILPECFQGISLSYRAIAFMKNVVCNVPTIRVNRTDRHICFKTDTAEAFIVYDNKIADYKIYVDMFKKDHAITLDRQYFKDVLKRLSLINDSVEFKISASQGHVEVKNSKFQQEIPILHVKNMDELGEIKFKILPEVLNKAIIGDDAQFSNETFLYLSPNTNGSYVLIFADDSGQWFSTASIR